MRKISRKRALGTYPTRHSSSRTGEDSKPSFDQFQTVIGVIISVATAFIAWQTYTLSERTEANNERLKSIEAQLSETKFGFERMRDIYDRTEKYLSSADQNEARGRILVVLINDIPEQDVRSELLSVVTEKAKIVTIAAKAADLKVGNTEPKPMVPAGKGFTGRQNFSFNSESYTLTTVEEFTFVDSEGTVWRVPKGFSSDGASIPRAFWSVIGSPLSGNYAAAVVLLDYYTTTRSHSTQAVHKMFYEALLASGVAASTAKTLSAAVNAFGPRWSS